jgi:hypothetical protein
MQLRSALRHTQRRCRTILLQRFVLSAAQELVFLAAVPLRGWSASVTERTSRRLSKSRLLTLSGHRVAHSGRSGH